MTDTSMIALGIFLVGQLIGAVAWAASMTTKMNFMLAAARDFSKEKSTFSTKDEVARALSISDKNVAIALASAEREIAAIWKRIDLIGGKI